MHGAARFTTAADACDLDLDDPHRAPIPARGIQLVLDLGLPPIVAVAVGRSQVDRDANSATEVATASEALTAVYDDLRLAV